MPGTNNKERKLLNCSNIQCWTSIYTGSMVRMVFIFSEIRSRELPIFYLIVVQQCTPFWHLSAGPTLVRTFALLEVREVALPLKTGIRTMGAVIDANGRLDTMISSARRMGLTIFEPRELESATRGVALSRASSIGTAMSLFSMNSQYRTCLASAKIGARRTGCTTLLPIQEFMTTLRSSCCALPVVYLLSRHRRRFWPRHHFDNTRLLGIEILARERFHLIQRH
jgi:hypothetical protein